MSPVSEAPIIQRLLPRQTLPLTPTTTPQTSITPHPQTYRTVNGIPPWAIAVIVIGGLLVLSLCGLLGLRLRTRWKSKRGAMDSITHVFAKAEHAGDNGAVGGSGGGGTNPDKGALGVAMANGSMVAEEGTKIRRRDSLLDQAEVRIRKLIKKTRPVTSNSTSRLVQPTTTTNEDDRPPLTSFSVGSGGGASSTTKLRDAPPTAFSFESGTLDPNTNALPNSNGDGSTTLFRNFSFKNPFSGRPQTGSSSVSGPQPHPGTSPPTISPPSNHPLSNEAVNGVDYYNSAYYNSLARPSEDDWGWADDSIARTIRGSYDNERDMEDTITTTNHAGTTLYHGYGGPTSIEGALSDESRSGGGGGIRTLFGGGVRDGGGGGGRDDNNFDSIPLETRTSPPSGFWNASRTNNNSRWVTR